MLTGRIMAEVIYPFRKYTNLREKEVQQTTGIKKKGGGWGQKNLRRTEKSNVPYSVVLNQINYRRKIQLSQNFLDNSYQLQEYKKNI